MLPWSWPDLWSEDGRGRAKWEGDSWGVLRDPSLTLAYISPPESHPAELGDFQRQFLLTSQLTWASGLLIRLVNTTRTAGGRDPPMSPADPLPPSGPPPQYCFSLCWNICPCLLPLSPFLEPGSLCVRFLPCCLPPVLPLSEPLGPCPLSEEREAGIPASLDHSSVGPGTSQTKDERRKGGGWGPWRPQL